MSPIVIPVLLLPLLAVSAGSAQAETLEEINHNYSMANKTMLLINGKWMSCCPTPWMENEEFFGGDQQAASNAPANVSYVCLQANGTCIQPRSH